MTGRGILIYGGGVMLALMTAGASPAPLPFFNAVAVPNGGHVVLRSGPVPGASVVKGRAEYVRMRVTSAGVLVIDKCPDDCPRRYEIEVEVVAPSFARVSLSNGGRVRSVGAFPRQQELTATVSNGGTVDVRSIAADIVMASVDQGGRVLTIPRESLTARVSNGGVVTWWGDAKVRQSVQHGGVIQKGEPDEMNLPLSDVGSSFPPPLRKHE